MYGRGAYHRPSLQRLSSFLPSWLPDLPTHWLPDSITSSLPDFLTSQLPNFPTSCRLLHLPLYLPSHVHTFLYSCQPIFLSTSCLSSCIPPLLTALSSHSSAPVTWRHGCGSFVPKVLVILNCVSSWSWLCCLNTSQKIKSCGIIIYLIL